MYVPAHFSMDAAEASAHIGACDVATLVTVNEGVITANLVPVMFDAQRGEQGALIGHLAKGNPQWTNVDPTIPTMAILAGPDAYVSPSAYATKSEHGRVVPTWNYTTVHVHGSLIWVHESERKSEIVTSLTNRHERDRRDPWQVSDAPQKYVSGLIDAIVGFELLITGVEGKAKLSQNKSAADRAGVIADLAGAPSENGRAVAEVMRQKPNQ